MIAENRTLEAIKTMASAMTHDFNSMLTTIVYSIELALNDIPEETLTHNDLSRVLLTSREAVDYIVKIMSFCSPAKSGIGDLDFTAFFNKTMETITHRLPSTMVLNTHNAYDGKTIKADGDQLSEIIDQLIDNAVQSLESTGGHIHFSASNGSMPSDGTSSAPCLILSISDNGSGISEESLPRIFDPFFTTKSIGKHKGLGLSIAHSLAVNHNGVLRVISKPHEETRFDIYIPVS